MRGDRSPPRYTTTAADPGGEERFARLFRTSFEPLSAYALRRAQPAAAMDAVAETLTIAWRRLESIPRGAELPWLYGVARKVLANQRRSASRYRALVERLAREVQPAVALALEDEGLSAALAELTPDERELLRLVAWEGLRPAELAVVLGCSPNAAAIRVHRARARLRAVLEGAEGASARSERAAERIGPVRTSNERRSDDG